MKKLAFRAGLAAMALIFAGLLAGCAGQRPGRETETEYSSDSDMEQGQMDETGETDEAGSEESAHDELFLNAPASVRVLEDLGAKSSLLSVPLYLAGDSAISCMVYIDPDEGESFMDSHGIQLFFSDDREDDWAVSEFVLEPGKDSYELVINVRQYADGVLERETEKTARVAFITDEQAGTRIEVESEGAYGGTYYSSCNYEEIGLSERYYTRAELSCLPTENLSLLRNTIYAHHGRKFKTDSLNEYFRKKIWYRGRIEPEAFTEELLTDTERANVRLIRVGIPI